MTEVLRSVLTALAREQNGEAAAPAAPAVEEKKEEQKEEQKAEKKPSVVMAWIGTAVGPLLVSGVAVIGLLQYKQLGGEMGKNRAAAGELRRELGQFRPRFVRKDEFNSRNLAVHSLIQDTESKSKAALDSARERFQGHKQDLRDCGLQVKELQYEVKRFLDRLAAKEKREGVTPPPPTPKGQ